VGKIRVVLADDHQQMIAMVRQTLGEEFEVMGTPGDGKQAVNAVLALNPRRNRDRYLNACAKRNPSCQTTPDG
jgi:hypothetical protein